QSLRCVPVDRGSLVTEIPVEHLVRQLEPAVSLLRVEARGHLPRGKAGGALSIPQESGCQAAVSGGALRRDADGGLVDRQRLFCLAWVHGEFAHPEALLQGWSSFLEGRAEEGQRLRPLVGRAEFLGAE